MYTYTYHAVFTSRMAFGRKKIVVCGAQTDNTCVKIKSKFAIIN